MIRVSVEVTVPLPVPLFVTLRLAEMMMMTVATLFPDVVDGGVPVTETG